MKKKLFSCILFCFLLVALTTSLARAATATVSLSPSTLTVDAYPETFYVNITISDASDVFGWQIVLLFNASILQCIDAEVPPDNIFGSGAIAPSPIIDNTNGKVTYGANIPPGAGTFNGSGLLCKIVFNATAMGETELTFDTDPAHPFYSYIYNDNMEDLPADFIPGTVTVIDEFAFPVFVLTLVSLTTAAIFFSKYKIRSKIH